MARHLFVTVLVLAAVPPVFAQPIICLPYAPPPMVYCPPITMCVCPLATAVVAPSTPVVVPERMQEQPKQEPKKMTQSEPLSPPREFATPKPAEPTEAKTNTKPTEPPTNVEANPKPTITPTGGITESVPPISVPKPVDLPKFEFSPPPADTPKPTNTIPPLDVPLPKPDDKPKTEEPVKQPTSALPKFDISFPKSDVAQPVEANKPTVSKSSPLSDERRTEFDVYPVDGPAPTSPTAKRTIGFVNKSDRDLLLTIDGKMVTLPTKNVLRTELPASFKWQVGGGKELAINVPTTAPGVDVVIRK